jgi:hypothetical protein
MAKQKHLRTPVLFILSLVFLFILFEHQNSYAVPSFARQTGLSCTACHTVYPELNTFGRHFKMMGYAMSKSAKPYEWPLPVSAVAKVSFSHLDKDLPPHSVEDTWADITDSTKNDVLYLPKIVGIYYAGRIYNGMGAMVQGNYNGVEDKFNVDITDIRYAGMTADKKFMYGATINNAPTLGDPWNSTPAWGFPYEGSDISPTPTANPLIEGELLEQQVGGVGLYGLFRDTLYAQASVYRSNRTGITSPLGAGTDTTTVVDGAMPYWRVALMHMWGTQALEVGTYGLRAKVYPEDMPYGDTNKFTDTGIDAQYQYVNEKHAFSIAAAWIHEKQDWDASFALDDTSNSSDDLHKFRINMNYYYKTRIGSIGGTLAYFSTKGDDDPSLYASDPIEGSRTGSPDSSGFILEGDLVLDNRHKLALQYVAYDKFNGSDSDYDGFGRDASDNNTLYALIRLMF